MAIATPMPPSIVLGRSSSSLSSVDFFRPHQHHRHHRRHPSSRPRSTISCSSSSLESVFIKSLVTAGTCHDHRRENGRKQHTSRQRRSYSYWTEGVEITPEEYTSLVDVYHDNTSQQPPPPHHYPLASRLTLTPAQESQYAPQGTLHQHIPLPPESDQHAAQLRHLNQLLRIKTGDVSHTTLWEAYTSLSTPRPAYLSLTSIRRLFAHLACTEFKNSPNAMHRYFALLNEVLDTCPNTTLSKGIWNSAISFAGRWMRNVSAAEVKSAVEVWMRMESFGVKADEVTFNILYDLAVRAGRFALAGTIEREIRQRALPLNRYFRTSVIYGAGLQRDGEGVRRAFKDLVDAGEIVDTSVMNCVILSLLRAGEAGAANSVFLRMKALHEAKFGTSAPFDWRMGKALGIRLDAEAKRLRKEEGAHEKSFFGGKFATRAKMEEVQRTAPIAPDARTYRILIGFAVECGELKKAKSLVSEMEEKGLHVHGSVYVGLLRGFSKFGGFIGGEWNSRALEEVWQDTLRSNLQYSRQSQNDIADDGDGVVDLTGGDGEQEEDAPTPPPPPPPIPETSRPTYFTRSLALAAVNAFYKCMGRERMLEVWAVAERRWIEQQDYGAGSVSEEELAWVRMVVEKLRAPGELEVGMDEEERKGNEGVVDDDERGSVEYIPFPSPLPEHQAQ